MNSEDYLEYMFTRWIVQVYEEFKILYYFLQGFKPVNILEIGNDHGGSFSLLCKVSSGKKIAVDIMNTDIHISKELHPNDYYFICGNSHDDSTFNKVKEICDSFDFIFIDGDHSYDGVKRDFHLYKQLLSNRGILGLHDVDINSIHKDTHAGQVYKFWQELDEGTKTEIICQKGCGKIKSSNKNEHFGGIGLWKKLP